MKEESECSADTPKFHKRDSEDVKLNKSIQDVFADSARLSLSPRINIDPLENQMRKSTMMSAV